MSAYAVPAVGAITARLRELIEKARTLKPTSSIEPPLPITDLESEASSIGLVPETNASGGSVDLTASRDHNEALKPNILAFETAARSIFYAEISAHNIDSESFVDVWNFLDILQLCADLEQCDISLPLYLIEELLDSQTIDGCMKVFNYLESRRERLVANLHQNKKLILLRSCNELLRRLSRAEDAVFCGRVFIFLFQSFPLGDKSAVNLRGEFHTENTTSFKLPPETEPNQELLDGDEAGEPQENEANGGANDAMEVDSKDHAEGEKSAEQSTDTKKESDVPVKPAEDQSKSVTFNATDAKRSTNGETTKGEAPQPLEARELYPIFWSLQNTFSNPTTLFNQEDFTTFKTGVEATLLKFKSMPKVLQSPHQGLGQLTRANNDEHHREERGIKRRSDGSEVVDTDAFSASFTPKYLTSYDLFELELSDLTFQRSVLVQTLIILDFLLSLTPTAKAKLSASLTPTPNRAVVYPFTLSQADDTWAHKTRKTIADYLSEQHDGKFFYRMVQSVLSRDKNWSAWKAANCPPISLPPIQTSSELDARKGAQQATEWKRLKVPPTSSIDLAFVTDEPDRTYLNDQMRWCKPEPEISANGRMIDYDDAQMMKWLRRIEEIDLDMEMESDEAVRRTMFNSRATASWRILRVLGTKDLAVFDKVGLNPEVGEDFTELKKYFEKKYEVPIEEQVEPNSMGEAVADVEMNEHVPDSDKEGINGALEPKQDASQPVSLEVPDAPKLDEPEPVEAVVEEQHDESNTDVAAGVTIEVTAADEGDEDGTAEISANPVSEEQEAQE